MIDVEELATRVASMLGPRAVGELAWRGRKGPIAMALPASVEELQELVRWAASESVALVPVGTGSKLAWGPPPRARENGLLLALSTSRLQRVVEYEPAEGVVTALAGTRMASLRDLVRREGHFLSPDVPAAELATLGGTIAAGQSGFDRLRHGPVRHHVLGVRAVTADATIAKSGGRLVKNVTGFDLQHLYAGSRGALCVIVEATLRLFPAPRFEAIVETEARDADELASFAHAATGTGMRPISIVATRAERGWKVATRLGGREDSVRAEIDASKRFATPVAVLTGANAVERARADRELDCAAEARPWLHATGGRTVFARTVVALERALREETLATRWLVQPGVATADVQLVAREGEKLDSARWIAELPRLRGELDALGASVTLRNPTRALAESGTPWGPPSGGATGLALMRRLRDRLDPGRVFARGRFEEDL